MKVWYNANSFAPEASVILTIGTFDGVHLGHQHLLQRLIDLKRKEGGQTALLTFDPHPRKLLFPHQDLKLILNTEEKLHILEQSGIDHVIVYPFDHAFASMTAEQYVNDFLVKKLCVKHLVIGYDHRFGNKREGSIQLLKELSTPLGFKVEEIPAQEVDHINVSSTRIRKAIEEGNIQMANAYLGHSFSFKGKVGRGRQLGRTIGFPTANIEGFQGDKIMPRSGVYVASAILNDRVLPGMLNIGFNPTVDNSQQLKAEMHIFDFAEDIYDRGLSVKVFHRLRDEYKFPSLQDLMLQLHQDKMNALQYHQNHPECMGKIFS